MSARNSIALSYHESCLRLSDVDLLKGPHWLNDQIISFYFEYLEKEVFERDERFLFISPEVTQCIKIVPKSEVSIFLEPLKASVRSIIFLALNDNSNADRAGGSHWSLLVFSRRENTFFHFDSSHNSNMIAGVELANILKNALNYRNAEFVTVDCLQQSNSYDCGIHVLCNCQNIANHVLRTGQVAGVKFLRDDTIRSKRRDILDLIIDLGGHI